MSWAVVKQSSFLQLTAPYRTRRCVGLYDNWQELSHLSQTVLPEGRPHPAAADRRVVCAPIAAAGGEAIKQTRLTRSGYRHTAYISRIPNSTVLKEATRASDRAGLLLRLPTTCPLHYSATTEPYGIRTLLFIYYIVPAGCGAGDALVRGNLLTATVQTAKEYVQGVTAPNVKDRSGLEVILQDPQGNEIFRCRHKAGPH
jgi:hypothetical protein